VPLGYPSNFRYGQNRTDAQQTRTTAMWLRPGLRAFTPVGHFWPISAYHTATWRHGEANDRNRPRVCKKSGRLLPVGRISIFSSPCELEWEKTWDSCSKRSRFYRLSPTDTNHNEFLHTLDPFRSSEPRRRMSASRCFCLRLCPLKVRHQRGKIVQRLRPRQSRRLSQSIRT